VQSGRSGPSPTCFLRACLSIRVVVDQWGGLAAGRGRAELVRAGQGGRRYKPAPAAGFSGRLLAWRGVWRVLPLLPPVPVPFRRNWPAHRSPRDFQPAPGLNFRLVPPRHASLTEWGFGACCRQRTGTPKLHQGEFSRSKIQRFVLPVPGWIAPSLRAWLVAAVAWSECQVPGGPPVALACLNQSPRPEADLVVGGLKGVDGERNGVGRPEIGSGWVRVPPGPPESPAPNVPRWNQ